MSWSGAGWTWPGAQRGPALPSPSAPQGPGAVAGQTPREAEAPPAFPNEGVLRSQPGASIMMGAGCSSGDGGCGPGGGGVVQIQGTGVGSGQLESPRRLKRRATLGARRLSADYSRPRGVGASSPTAGHSGVSTVPFLGRGPNASRPFAPT